MVTVSYILSSGVSFSPTPNKISFYTDNINLFQSIQFMYKFTYLNRYILSLVLGQLPYLGLSWLEHKLLEDRDYVFVYTMCAQTLPFHFLPLTNNVIEKNPIMSQDSGIEWQNYKRQQGIHIYI